MHSTRDVAKIMHDLFLHDLYNISKGNMCDRLACSCHDVTDLQLAKFSKRVVKTAACLKQWMKGHDFSDDQLINVYIASIQY